MSTQSLKIIVACLMMLLACLIWNVTPAYQRERYDISCWTAAGNLTYHRTNVYVRRGVGEVFYVAATPPPNNHEDMVTGTCTAELSKGK